MHEMSLVRDVVEVVTAAAERGGVSRVAAVNLTIGQGRDVVPELFDGLFAHLAQGTCAEGAELVVRATPYLARCGTCGEVYRLRPVDRNTWACPRCGHEGNKLVSGMEFSIDSIVAAPADAPARRVKERATCA
ncbi:MAG: hydrogenase maturation nickel metallochaperone HypA [Coriobacteriales bacterium]|jgi:hydrogenase nickel incorporation protein HypA/HybF